MSAVDCVRIIVGGNEADCPVGFFALDYDKRVGGLSQLMAALFRLFF